MRGLLSFPGGGAYAASKHAVVAVAEQTAVALQDTGVSVTVLCPGLVRSAMSDVGVDPAQVATEGLAAVRAGRFLVAPREWSIAIRQRTENLLDGDPPSCPFSPEARSGPLMLTH